MRKRLQIILQKIESVNGFGLYAAALLLSMAGAYSLLAGRLGFYYDDWEGVFLYRQGFSPQQVWEYFLVDRPFSSLVHWAFHPLLGTSPIGWNILVLLLHWAAILLLVKSLLALFPQRVLAVGWTGLLLALYPGIMRHFVPRTSAPHYLSLFLFTLSLWLMLKAYQTPRRQKAFLALSIICALAQVLIIEYFATMEIARLFILLYFFYQKGEQKQGLWRRALLAWLPYTLVFAAFAVFKFSILPALAQADALTAKHSLSLWQEFLAAPLATLTFYANLVLQDCIHAVFYVWTLPIVPADIDLASTAVVVSWLLGPAGNRAPTKSGYKNSSGTVHHRPAPGRLAGLADRQAGRFRHLVKPFSVCASPGRGPAAGRHGAGTHRPQPSTRRQRPLCHPAGSLVFPPVPRSPKIHPLLEKPAKFLLATEMARTRPDPAGICRFPQHPLAQKLQLSNCVCGQHALRTRSRR
jgi:hypothetical protein